MLEEVKLALRVFENDFDLEINDLIEAAKSDLRISGVIKIEETDSLIKRAVILYCKINYGWANDEYERLQKAYDLLKIHLALSNEYNGGDIIG